jgi:lipopolysaccharide export system protein LptA
MRAKLNRDLDETRGNYIAYDAKTEFFRVQSAKDAPIVSGGQPNARVRAIIQPKSKDKPASSATTPPPAPVKLKPAPGIANPRTE